MAGLIVFAHDTLTRLFRKNYWEALVTFGGPFFNFREAASKILAAHGPSSRLC